MDGHLASSVRLFIALVLLVLLVISMALIMRATELPGEKIRQLEAETQFNITKHRLFFAMFDFVATRDVGPLCQGAAAISSTCAQCFPEHVGKQDYDDQVPRVDLSEKARHWDFNESAIVSNCSNQFMPETATDDMPAIVYCCNRSDLMRKEKVDMGIRCDPTCNHTQMHVRTIRGSLYLILCNSFV